MVIEFHQVNPTNHIILVFFLLNQGIINNTLIPDYSTCVTPSDVILNESKHSVQHNLHQASLNALDCKAEVPSTS